MADLAQNPSRWFQRTAIAIFCLFAFTMVFVVATAYLRKSGATGLDPAKIQQMRMHAQEIAENKR